MLEIFHMNILKQFEVNFFKIHLNFCDKQSVHMWF